MLEGLHLWLAISILISIYCWGSLSFVDFILALISCMALPFLILVLNSWIYLILSLTLLAITLFFTNELYSNILQVPTFIILLPIISLIFFKITALFNSNLDKISLKELFYYIRTKTKKSIEDTINVIPYLTQITVNEKIIPVYSPNNYKSFYSIQNNPYTQESEYAVSVPDNSLSPYLHQRDIAIIDVINEPEDNDIILLSINEKQPLFRLLRIEDDYITLTAFNEVYPKSKSMSLKEFKSHCHIVGIVTEIRRNIYSHNSYNNYINN